jgi:hypothetical protein
LRQQQGSDRLKQYHGWRGDELRRRLMAQMTVGTIRVVASAMVIPIADHSRGENQQHDERQRNPEYANCLPQSRAEIHF